MLTLGVRVCISGASAGQALGRRLASRPSRQEAPTLLRTRAIKEEEKLSFHTITSYSWEDDGKFVKYATVLALARAGSSSVRAPLGVLSSEGTLGLL